jgi:DNA repair exonuclease SbcCD ATPase subunit
VKLRAIRVFDVRCFGGEGVAIEDIADGLNTFAEPNETGKSTIFDALHALLFTKHTSKDNRIEKKFLSGPIARVRDLNADREIARADEAQSWINRMIGAGQGGHGPAGLLWVRQGHSSNLTEGTEVRAVALGNIVEEELSAMTGGQRMRMMLSRCNEVLEALLTPTGLPKAEGGYYKARQSVKALEAQLAGLGERLDSARSDLTERQRMRNRLAKLTDPPRSTEQDTHLSDAREVLAETQKLADRIRQTKTDLELAELTQRNALKERDAFATDCGAARQSKSELEKHQGALPDLQGAADRAVEAEASALIGWQSIEKALNETATVLAKARGAQSARETKERHDALTETLAKAEKAAKSERDARSVAQALRIKPADIDGLARLVTELAKAETRVSSASSTLRMIYETGHERRVRLGETPLKHDVDVQIDGASALTIDEVGKLSIAPGSGEAAEVAKRAFADAQKVLSDELAALGCENPAGARASLRKRESLESQAETHKATVAALAPDGIDALATQVAELASKLEVANDSDLPDISAAEQTHEKYQEEELHSRGAYEGAKETSQATLKALDIHKGKHEAADVAYTLAVERTGPENEWSETQRRLGKAVEDAEAKLTPLRNALAELEDMPLDVTLAEATVARLEEAKENRQGEIVNLEKNIAVLDDRLKNAADHGLEEACSETSGQLETARLNLQRYEAELMALQRLKAALERANAQVKERYFEPVNAELKPLLGLLYGGAHIHFDDETLAPQELTRDGVAERMDALSGGTQEQIAILTRLAFAKLLAKTGSAPPVILDDALIFSDDDRIEKMFTALHAQTKDLQIIAFTCRQRAFEALGGNVLKLSPWVPDES